MPLCGLPDFMELLFLAHKSRDVTDIYRKMSDEAFDRAATIIDTYFTKKYVEVQEDENFNSCAKNVPIE